jgi:hypothetical protein
VEERLHADGSRFRSLGAVPAPGEISLESPVAPDAATVIDTDGTTTAVCSEAGAVPAAGDLAAGLASEPVRCERLEEHAPARDRPVGGLARAAGPADDGARRR